MFGISQSTMERALKTTTAILAVLVCCQAVFALEPDEILVIANKGVAASGRLARYYCKKRAVPTANILYLSLGMRLEDSITRGDYEKWLSGPIRKELLTRKDGGRIRCLLTTYGVPTRVGKRGPLVGFEGRLRQLRELAKQEKNAVEQLEQTGLANSAEHSRRKQRLAQLQMDIDRITGKETDASVDSELSVLLFGIYDLYRWQPNMLRNTTQTAAFKTLMLCRLDGPDYLTAKGLIDKAIAAEENGLQGAAYVDSRGIIKRDLYGHFDQSLRDLAILTRSETKLLVKEERTEKLFAPGTCPQTAIYCGWYSLRKYVDAFDFVDGAIGYHIASFEAMDIRDPNSTQWCPAMLADGITATLGAVAEPYLHSFPEPRLFFMELYSGRCLVEAFYRTKPFNSWQLLLIGDPLYRPFKKP
ncbi:MAG: TIGR03790 family protein [Phycisphaerales bacterium]|nr:MAG: TIGR03790 family protein [Phycisphaerales bacterium]